MAEFKRRTCEPSWAEAIGGAIGGLVGSAVVAARYLQVNYPRMKRQAKTTLIEIRSWPDRADQALLDQLSAALGRKITRKDLDTQEKQERIANELAFGEKSFDTKEYKKIREDWERHKNYNPPSPAKATAKEIAPSKFPDDEDDVPF